MTHKTSERSHSILNCYFLFLSPFDSVLKTFQDALINWFWSWMRLSMRHVCHQMYGWFLPFKLICNRFHNRIISQAMLLLLPCFQIILNLNGYFAHIQCKRIHKCVYEIFHFFVEPLNQKKKNEKRIINWIRIWALYHIHQTIFWWTNKYLTLL